MSVKKTRLKKTTTIRVFNETWHVPRGFGRIYRDAAKADLAWVPSGTPDKISSVIALLGLIGYEAPREQVAAWDLRRRVEAIVYASTEHARASDNPVQRHPRPSWLPDRSWQGPNRGEGAFGGPTGTPIT